MEKLVSTAVALRRLVFQLVDLGLPVDPFWRRDGGLAFDLVSSYSTGERVTIGHAGGVITIDLVESLDAYRESLRVHGEPYRTMLGHFRHEVGYYYQIVLVETGDGASRYLDECRDLFGDERTDYQTEIQRHYTYGPPKDWSQSYISEYATMQFWEDFAECFAHYLHITDTIDTVREGGLVLCCGPTGFASRCRATSSRSRATTTRPSNGCCTTGSGCRWSSTESTPQWERRRCTRSKSRRPWYANSASSTG